MAKRKETDSKNLKKKSDFGYYYRPHQSMQCIHTENVNICLIYI